MFRKADYHRLVRFVPDAEVNPEVAQKLDAILSISKRAQPRAD